MELELALFLTILLQRQNNRPPKDWQTGYFQGPWITSSHGKCYGPTQVGVRKSSGFCVISSYFQLPISIAIQTARPMAHNGNRKGEPIALPLTSLFMSFTFESFSVLAPSLLTNPLSPTGGRSRWVLKWLFVFLVLCWEVGSPPALKNFKNVVWVDVSEVGKLSQWNIQWCGHT